MIDVDCGNWNEDLVRGTLNKDEAKIVYGLPIIQTGLQDKMIWASIKYGIYSVKSAYHMDMSRKRRVKWAPLE